MSYLQPAPARSEACRLVSDSSTKLEEAPARSKTPRCPHLQTSDFGPNEVAEPRKFGQKVSRQPGQTALRGRPLCGRGLQAGHACKLCSSTGAGGAARSSSTHLAPSCLRLQITGNFPRGAHYSELPVGDFYMEFSTKLGKPMVIPETGAWFNQCDKNKKACESRGDMVGPRAAAAGLLVLVALLLLLLLVFLFLSRCCCCCCCCCCWSSCVKIAMARNVLLGESEGCEGRAARWTALTGASAADGWMEGG
jgi:hypothetical protein